jgi:hypothetical protein
VLAPEEVTLWVVALGMGAVVILVVIVLLTMLVLLLRDTDASVSTLAEVAQTATGGGPREDAGTAAELETAASIAKGLEQEIVLHRQLLSGR